MVASPAVSAREGSNFAVFRELEASGYARGTDKSRASWSDDSRGFVGVWDINDNSKVPPRAVVKGFNTKLSGCGGVAIDEGRIGHRRRKQYVHHIPDSRIIHRRVLENKTERTEDRWAERSRVTVSGM